jgi:hypothetical protein
MERATNEFDVMIEPDEEDPDAAEVLVDGTIGGRQYRFLLDTGAARTSVALDDYTAGFSSAEKSHSSGVFANSSDDLITVPSIEVGPISKKDFTVVRVKDRGPHVSNLIGMDFLKDSRCHFRFDERRVSVDADDDLSHGDGLQELVLDTKSHPYVAVGCGTSNAMAVWDTGAGITIVDTNFIKRVPAFFREVGESTGRDSTGAEMETPMFIMSTTMIGGAAFAPHKVAGVDLSHVNSTVEIPMDLILGFSTLSQANWLFDFPRKRWAISKRLDI